MPLLSSSPENISPYYEVVVIGSGYGGSIMASRFARAGKKVCILERGIEFQPGDYPDTLLEAADQIQINTPHKHIGKSTGLFDFNVHKGISVLVGCGLGGTSLINANVSIKPDTRIFDDAVWPKPIRDEYNDSNSLLHASYIKAAQMLDARPLPDHIKLKKLEALQKSAEYNKEKFYRTDINVNFTIDGVNKFGIHQKPCNLCGDCCSGCNHQAKNTLIMNYLPDAKAHGAEIFTECDVQYVSKKDKTWQVHYYIASSGEQKFTQDTLFITADILVLSAGTLGSTQIMLRSKAKGLKLSDKIGESFSGNGDVLGFAYNTDHEINGVGAGTHTVDSEIAAGPCITGIIDLRNTSNLNDGMIIEDAAIPGPLAKILPEALAIDDVGLGVHEEQEKDHRFWNKIKRKARVLDSMIRGAYHGAIKHTQTYLLMTHDGEHGRMKLNKDRLEIDWAAVGKEAIFQHADTQLRKETLALSGEYIKNPVWIKEMNNELVTVHPLGGCIMGENSDTSVVNHKGQVYNTEGDVYEGFYITDGSVVPRSLGVNPLLTISALSERCAAMAIKDLNLTIDYDKFIALQPQQLDNKTGIEFSETMRGFYSKNIKHNEFLSGYEHGKVSNESFVFTLTIRSDDVNDMISSPLHEARISGVVEAPGLSLKPITVTEGVFNLFVDDPSSVNTKLMKYSFRLNTEEGENYFFKGFKHVHHDKGLDEWPDTSTLYSTIFNGKDEKAPILGQGILHIALADFEKQMQTIKAIHPANVIEGLKGLAAFGNYFSKSLFEVYGGIAAPNEFYNPDAPPRKKRPLRMNTPEYHPFKTEDGLELLLVRYKGGDKGPLMMVHAFNGNRLNFAIDTIDTNVAEYFYSHGFDVWLLENRLSCSLRYANNQYNCDQIANYDYPAAIEKIRNITHADTVDIMAHCVGSITVFMSLLAGLKHVRSVISTQIAADFFAKEQVKLKSGLHIPQVLEFLGIKSLNAYAAENENWENKLFDQFSKTFADVVGENCNDPVCHRMTFMFGTLVHHANLNEATHKANVEMWGKANMTTFDHLTKMIRNKQLLSVDGRDVYMPHLDRLSIPITFIHGELNQVFDPESTLTTYNKLRAVNDPDLYTHHLIKGYGHCDCLYGKNAVVDVYPFMLNHFKRFYPDLVNS